MYVPMYLQTRKYVYTWLLFSYLRYLCVEIYMVDSTIIKWKRKQKMYEGEMVFVTFHDTKTKWKHKGVSIN